MVRRTIVLTLAAVLFASSAVAEEPDAETRFHDAYVLEVIDGETADAAKAYLALLEDDAVAVSLRDEARFRFAICTVLLGRPDEGRMQLQALVENERASTSLRERAGSYLESISGLGVGTELERKLGALVFDLGRSDVGDHEVAAYRDFEIIGKPAIPFLEQLLQHPDLNLRRHALRLLIRLGAEDLIARWTPEIAFGGGQGFQADLVERYLAERPEEVRRLEAKLLALPDERLSRLLGSLHFEVSWSFDFLRALTTRGEDLAHLGFLDLGTTGTSAQRWALARECILGDDAVRRDEACDWAAYQPGGPPEGPPDALVELLWPAVVRRQGARWGDWVPTRKAGTPSGHMVAWARRLPTDFLLASLSDLVRAREAPSAPRAATPLANRGIARVVEHVLEERDLDGPQLDRYEALIRRWTVAVARGLAPERRAHTTVSAAKPLRHLVARLPAERAAALVRWLFEGPAHERAAWFRDVVEVERPEDPLLLVEAVRAADPEQRGELLRRLRKLGPTAPSADLVQAELDALPALLAVSSVGLVDGHRTGQGGFWTTVVHAMDRVPDDALEGALREIFAIAVAMDADAPEYLFDRLVDFRAQTAEGLERKSRFLARFVLPAIDAQHANLSVDFRRHVMDTALTPLRHRYGFSEDDKRRLAGYVLRHLEDLQRIRWSLLAAHPDLFPLERWLPAVPVADLGHARAFTLTLQPERVDAAMMVLAADVAKLDDSVLTVLVRFATPKVATEVMDRMLASEDVAVRHRAVEILRDRTGAPASPAGLESALAGLLAEVDPDLGDLAKVAVLLSQVQPSEKLLPAAERLLASDETSDRLQGITLAKRLSREEFVPALSRLLTSLDANLRDRAKAAIHSIQELKRMQAEAGEKR